MNSRPIFARPSPDALLNPRRDPTFKAIFTQGTRESSIALGDFLSSVIGERTLRCAAEKSLKKSNNNPRIRVLQKKPEK